MNIIKRKIVMNESKEQLISPEFKLNQDLISILGNLEKILNKKIENNKLIKIIKLKEKPCKSKSLEKKLNPI